MLKKQQEMYESNSAHVFLKEGDFKVSSRFRHTG